jgi:mono/diheme cytochrome c family protein
MRSGHDRWRRRQAALGSIIVIAGVAVTTHTQRGPALPDGAGRDIVASKCLVCHEADVIRQQRLSSGGWLRELDKMGRWGAVLTDVEREQAAAYLARSFGTSVRSSSESNSNSAGAAVFTRKCLGCHQTDIVEQQRLSESAWGRELDKMVRWGASVEDAERADLLRYLSERFGPR